MGKGEERLTDPQGSNEFHGFSVKEEGRLAHRIVYHLHVGPADSFAKSQSNGFEKGLFGCKSNGVTFSRSRLSLATRDLFFGEDTTDEEVTPSGDEAVDPFDIYNIDARAKDHNERVKGFKDSRFMGSTVLNRLLLAHRTPWPLESQLFDESDHFPDGLVEADEDRSGNNAVSDVEFFNLPDFCY